MAIVRWEPAREVASFQSEMNRLFSSFFDTPDGSRAAGAQRWVPPMDLVETDDHFVLRADLPGLTDDDVDIAVQDNVLTISGERKYEHEAKEEGYYRVERAFGLFSRSLTLPEAVDPEAISASFTQGVLEVRIPKPEQRKARRIAIQVGDATAPASIEGEASRA